MVDWSEIEALQNELEEVQAENVSSRLSERNCVELIMKLKQLNLVELIHSINGKFYLTMEQLEKEILASLADFGGRASLADISNDIGIDFYLVESTAGKVVDRHGLIKFQGQIISQDYIQFLSTRLHVILDNNGVLAIADICRDHDLTGEFVIEQVLPLLNAKTNSKKTVLMTDSFLLRIEVRLRGYLCSAVQPVKVDTFYERDQVDEHIFNSLLNNLLKAGQVVGSVVGRGSSVTFIPSIYVKRQTEEIKEKIDSQGYIPQYELMKCVDQKKGVEIVKFMKENFPKFKKLDSNFVSPAFVDNFKQELATDLENETIIYIYDLLPCSFSEDDVEILLSVFDLGSNVRLGTDSIITTKGLIYAKSLFSEIISSRAEKAAQHKIVTIITEEDLIKEPEQKSKEVENKKGGKAGKGAKAKAKGKNKKKDSTEEDASPAGVLSEEEIHDVIDQDDNLDNLHESARQSLVDILHPYLSSEYQNQATSIFVKKKKQDQSESNPKKKRQEEEEIMTNKYIMLYLCDKSLNSIMESVNSVDYMNMVKYLHKTIGVDLVNTIFSLSSNMPDKNLTQPMRSKIIAQHLINDAKDILTKLDKAKTPSEVIEHSQMAAELGAEMMIKHDKKKEKLVFNAYLDNQSTTIKEMTELPVTLHMGTTIVYGRVFHLPIHYPGKMTETIIKVMQTKLSTEQYSILMDAQKDLKKFLSKEEVDVQRHIDNIKTLVSNFEIYKQNE